MQKVFRRGHALTQLAVCAMLAACGGGGDSGGSSGGRLQQIDFDYPGGGMLLDGPVTLHAVATSGLPVSFESTTPDTCTVSGDQLTLVSAAECRVVARQEGGMTDDGVLWAAADEASQLFVVLKHTQQVAFAPPEYVYRANTSTIQLSATSESGLPVTFTSSTPAACTLEGSTVKVLAKGVCAVKAAVDGNHDYAEQTVDRFIAIDPLLVADGFDPAGSGRGYSDTMSTKQAGNVTVNAWGSPLGVGWEKCDGDASGDWCYRTVSADGSTMTSALHYPEANWSPGGWQYGFNRIDIFAPGLSQFNASDNTTSGLRVTTETALGFNLGINHGLFMAGRPIVMHIDLGKRNNGCNVRLSAQVWPADGLASYSFPLSDFVVTDGCGLAGVDTASLDDQVRKLPNPNSDYAGYKAALEGMQKARDSAMKELKESDIVRVRFHLMDVNDSQLTDGVYASDVTLKGAIKIQ
ncbi:hypothetical protein [Ideonella sp. YS5]|uniref:hypothetical protein n=1 Tax=Ideonella sp. YS5 TaxID=3453714 RepID=UPI003EEAFF0F